MDKNNQLINQIIMGLNYKAIKMIHFNKKNQIIVAE
jgi:hypothetical protein